MGKLLSTIDQPTKKPYQLYTIEHGIERLSVKVPLQEAASFEELFAKSDKSKQSILKLLETHHGAVVGSR